MGSNTKASKALLFLGVAGFILLLSLFVFPAESYAYSLSNNYFQVETGSYGEISSLKLTGDTFPTNYVMNTVNAPKQNTAGHQWFGELMFKYRLGSGAWTTATTNKSADVRSQSQSGNTVTVTYQNSGNASGIKNFKVVETYSLVNDYLLWSINVTNTSSQTLEIGDFGLPLPFNEFWTGGDAIYETRAVDHSFTGNNSSYVYATRPSGLGPFLLMVPDASTGAGFEYQDHWRTQERSSEEAAWCQDQSGWQNGLNVFYIHSNVIKSTNRGYLPNTSLVLSPNQSKTYSFKFFKVSDEAAMKERLYTEGLIDVNVVPGMIFATNMTAKVDLHTSKTINSINLPAGAAMTYLNTVGTNHRIYSLTLSQLGPNNITVNYGNGEKTVLQFYAIEPVDTALQRHATHMVQNTQWNTSDIRNKVFDDWMLNTKAKRNNFAGYWGWGDDWGLTHGQFLAEKNVLNPVASEVDAVDDYLETAIWTNLMNGHHSDYLIHDFLMYGENTTPTYRGYAYPHIYNTYFSMYKIAKQYPELITYNNSRNTYLLRCYNIFKALYGSGVSYNWNTGLMGELTTPEIIQALRDEGYTSEANTLSGYMTTKYNNFRNTTYPYGSEYSYDNTGEEAVYTLAKTNNNTNMMNKINLKTRACRGNQPVWYYYADPVTNCGENWWNFQYTTSLAGYCMDDWMRYNSTTPEMDARMAFAAKLANLSCINSGQISSDPLNLGAVSWTYQAEKGNLGGQGVGNGTLVNGWRDMAGEADLGLFGALKILSSDVAVDPVFGLYGYGCDVTLSGSNYTIIPKDGLMKRLNLITEKLYLELDRDQYTSVTVSKAKNYVQLNLKNQYTSAAHTTKLSVTGLLAGTYDILINNVKSGTLTVSAGKKAIASISVGTAANYDIKISIGTPGANTAPVVNAGPAATFVMPVVTLNGTASDDGLPNGVLTTNWSLESGAGSASFSNAAGLKTTATVSAPGTYTFKLTASDGALSSSSLVTVTVTAAPADGCVTNLTFNETSGSTAYDSSGFQRNGTLNGGAGFAAGKNGNALNLNGNNQYVSLPNGVVSNLTDFTAAAWVKVNSITDWARIFDFGTGTTNYMFLTASAGGSGLRFAITTAGNGSESQLNYASGLPLPAGTWKHIAVTLSGNTGILYIDGSEVARNAAMNINPAGLGDTNQNYIGRSQWSGDSYLNGMVDDFKIYNRALSQAEVRSLAAGSSGETNETNIAANATPSASFCSSWESVNALNDGYDPAGSNDRTHLVYGNWDNPGTTQWVQYDFDKAYTISKCDIYWFSDIADGGGIDVPASCTIKYWDGTGWVNVRNSGTPGVLADQYNTTVFDPVETSRIRVEMTAKASTSTGILEWRVWGG
ncbi:DUF5695 domain-containing protein [Ruminiclostridium cellobioparum]|uniref:DUF5695 domain-containing protein n=1 Tax=Ruminiclostridium cellobioparum TaxID=29355 RepID=UPI0004831CC8|nr:DUF5695 domain-containing protein [Ruminiclostridium cellobioparum]